MLELLNALGELLDRRILFLNMLRDLIVLFQKSRVRVSRLRLRTPELFVALKPFRNGVENVLHSFLWSFTVRDTAEEIWNGGKIATAVIFVQRFDDDVVF